MDDQARYHMGLLRGRVKRLEGLIDGILHYSRANRLEGAVVDVDTARSCRTSGSCSRRRRPRSSSTTSLPTITTMKIPLQQVLMNLMSNAVKYNRDRDLTIEVGAIVEDNKPPGLLREGQRRRHRARVPPAHLGPLSDARSARQGREHRHRSRRRSQDRRDARWTRMDRINRGRGRDVLVQLAAGRKT